MKILYFYYKGENFFRSPDAQKENFYTPTGANNISILFNKV